MEVAQYWIKDPGPRGAFARYIAFLWSPGHDCDSDGDSEPPNSQTWTELTLINRHNEVERLDVDPRGEKPLILGVRSDCHYLAARMTYAIAVTAGGTVIDCANMQPIDPSELLPLMEGFDVTEALARYTSAI